MAKPDASQVVLWGYDVMPSRRQMRADVTDLLVSATAHYSIGQVPELSLQFFDTGSKVIGSDMAHMGALLEAHGQHWEVGALDFEKGAAGTTWTIQARSTLARRLRRVGVKPPGRGTPVGTFVQDLAKQFGGKALTQPTTEKCKHVQASTGLGMVDELAQRLGWAWAEYGKKLILADPHYALNHDIGLPRYPLTWLSGDGAADAVAFTGRLTDDDASTRGTASAELTLAAGLRLRPYMTLEAGAGMEGPLAGTWLVTDVTVPLAGSDAATVAVELSRPRKGVPQPPPSVDAKGAVRADADPDSGAAQPVKGSSFSDAPRPKNWVGRSVEKITELWQQYRHTGYPGQGGIHNRCLGTSQAITGHPIPGTSMVNHGSCPNTLVPELGSRLHRDKTPVPGAVLLYTGGDYGHAVVYMGGGRTLSTDATPDGRYNSGSWSICPSDAIAGGFGKHYAGWY